MLIDSEFKWHGIGLTKSNLNFKKRHHLQVICTYKLSYIFQQVFTIFRELVIPRNSFMFIYIFTWARIA